MKQVGQYYRVHNDYIPSHTEKPYGVRTLTMFFYLNDVEQGGGTRFPNLNNITVYPKAGRILIWPSIWDHLPGYEDFRTNHEALPVEKGNKYAANAWFHQKETRKSSRHSDFCDRMSRSDGSTLSENANPLL